MNRLAALPILVSALLAACATTPDQLAGPSLVAASAPMTSLVAGAERAADPLPEDVLTIEADPSETGVVCEAKRRPGSRIATTVCYSPEERAALESDQAEHARQYARDLDRERAMKATQQQGRPVASDSIIVFQ